MTDNNAVAYDPLLPAVHSDPHPYDAALRRHAPVFYVESLDAYAVSRYADGILPTGRRRWRCRWRP